MDEEYVDELNRVWSLQWGYGVALETLRDRFEDYKAGEAAEEDVLRYAQTIVPEAAKLADDAGSGVNEDSLSEEDQELLETAEDAIIDMRNQYQSIRHELDEELEEELGVRVDEARKEIDPDYRTDAEFREEMEASMRYTLSDLDLAVSTYEAEIDQYNRVLNEYGADADVAGVPPEAVYSVMDQVAGTREQVTEVIEYIDEHGMMVDFDTDGKMSIDEAKDTREDLESQFSELEETRNSLDDAAQVYGLEHTVESYMDESVIDE